MPSRTAALAKTAPAASRAPRTRVKEKRTLDRATVLQVALQLTKNVSLADLSVVYLARELGVTPGLIHYYLGGRDPLTSGVMNAFWREIIDTWPREDGDWSHNLETVAQALYRTLLRYPGIASYTLSHNRYRMVQDVREGETDYGILFFEKFVATMRQAGFDAMRTATYAHLIVELVVSNAHNTTARRWPGQHSEFLNEKLAQLDPQAFPCTHFVRESITQLNGAEAFAIALRLMLQALSAERVQRVGT
jgi:AcrR family transcriptional regulator